LRLRRRVIEEAPRIPARSEDTAKRTHGAPPWLPLQMYGGRLMPAVTAALSSVPSTWQGPERPPCGVGWRSTAWSVFFRRAPMRGAVPR
jgi:hypothetical protein